MIGYRCDLWENRPDRLYFQGRIVHEDNALQADAQRFGNLSYIVQLIPPVHLETYDMLLPQDHTAMFPEHHQHVEYLQSHILLALCLSALLISCYEYFLINVNLRKTAFNSQQLFVDNSLLSFYDHDA